MSYVPAIPSTGYAGWTFLNRTMASQTATIRQVAFYSAETGPRTNALTRQYRCGAVRVVQFRF